MKALQRVLGYSGDGGQATSAMLGKASGIAIDNHGNIYIADTDNNRITTSRGINRDHYDHRRYRRIYR